MVFQRSDFRPELFPNHASLVYNDPTKAYLLRITEEELRNEEVEKRYGPFDLENNNSPNGSPRPMIRNEELTYKKTQDAIDDLKRLIAERQARNEALGRSLLAATRGSTTVPLKAGEASSAADTITKLIEVKMSTTESQFTATSSSSSKVDGVPEQVPVVVVDSDSDDMSIDSQDNGCDSGGSENNDNQDDGSNSGESNNNEHQGNGSNSGGSSNNGNNNGEDNNRNNNGTTDQLTEEEEDRNLALLLEEQKLAAANVEKYSMELDSLKTNKKDLQVKLLGMRVRMSMNKNKNELKSKLSAPESATPSIGNKRDYFTASNNNNIPRPSYSQRNSGRRVDYDDKMNYGYNSNNTAPPFYQQLPPQALHGYTPIAQPNYLQSRHVQQQQPPPPRGLPPQTQALPPPPPPPGTDSLPSYIPAGPPPTPLYSNTYQNNVAYRYPQSRRHNNNNQAQTILSTAAAVKSQMNSNTTAPKPPRAIIDESSGIEPMMNTSMIFSALREIEQFVSLRIFNDNTIDYPVVQDRPVARPKRLATVDNYTMPMNMINIDENKDSEVWQPPTQRFTLPAGMPIEAEMDPSWFESPFFIMLRRKADGQAPNSSFAKAIEKITSCIYGTDNLTTLKIGSFYFVNLENALQTARGFAFQHPKNEFLAALKLELSYYVHGNNAVFMDDYTETIATMPLSIDVEWQRIRIETVLSNQLPLIIDLLHRIAKSHTTADSKESLAASNMTTEVLIRLLRMNGLEPVLKLLANKKDVRIDTEKQHIFNLDDVPGLYLQEQDKYNIWMLILYYFVSKKLPEGLCSVWMYTLVKDGEPTKILPPFMIDWTTCLQQPLDRATLFGAINILLSMLRHFGNKACNDIRRKPLLVGVWRTLFDFLSNIPNYKNAGTLMLVRKFAGLVEQVPEIQEIITALEIKAGNENTVIVENIYASRKKMSQSNLFTLTHHIARAYYENKSYSNPLLLVIANILLYPLLEAESLPNQAEMMQKLCNDYCSKEEGEEEQYDSSSNEECIIVYRYVQHYYANALSVDNLIEPPSAPQHRRNSANPAYRKMTFAWINILLLTQMCKSVVTNKEKRKQLDIEFKVLFEQSMKALDSMDEKLIVFKYASQYVAKLI